MKFKFLAISLLSYALHLHTALSSNTPSVNEIEQDLTSKSLARMSNNFTIKISPYRQTACYFDYAKTSACNSYDDLEEDIKRQFQQAHPVLYAENDITELLASGLELRVAMERDCANWDKGAEPVQILLKRKQ